MKNSILSFNSGKTLNKNEMKAINGGYGSCPGNMCWHTEHNACFPCNE